MAKFEVGRRGLLKLMGVAPVAAPALIASAAPLIGPDAVQSAASSAIVDAGSLYGGYGGSSSKSVLGKILWGELRREFHARNNNMERLAAYRSGVLDHDVAVMGSWKPWFKATTQRLRDEAYIAETERLRLKLWPRTDDDDD